MELWLVFRRDKIMFNHGAKRNDWSFQFFSKTPFVWSLPIRQEILNVSQIGFAFHGICPPFFIQTWLQQYCRRTFFHSAYCSLSNPICFRSVWCWRTMIPGKIFTGFAKFQWIVSVNDSKNFCKLLCVSLRLDPLGGQVLHHDHSFNYAIRLGSMGVSLHRIHQITMNCQFLTWLSAFPTAREFS